MNRYTGKSLVMANYYNIKKYNDNYYKVVIFKYPVKNNESDDLKVKKDRNKNDEKLDCSLSRSRSAIFEYALCNEFDYFVTLTLNKRKYDRYDLDTYIKDLGQYIRDMRKKHRIDIQYLLIPEEHKDGAWHFHGLIKNLPSDDLKEFKIDDNIPYRLKKMIANGRVIYNWLSYADKFGWVTLEKVKNQTAISKYITKYISKEVLETFRKRKNKKIYYNSRGLKRAEKIKEGSMFADTAPNLESLEPFENDYIITYDLSGKEYSEIFT